MTSVIASIDGIQACRDEGSGLADSGSTPAPPIEVKRSPIYPNLSLSAGDPLGQVTVGLCLQLNRLSSFIAVIARICS
jgi:hypothetical protein